MYERWIRMVLRFRVLVLLLWLAIVVAGAVASTRLPALLSNSFGVPGSGSDRARLILMRGYRERPEGTFTVVFQVRRYDRRLQAALRRRLVAAAGTVPGGHAGPLRAGGGIFWADVDSTLDLKRAKGYTDDLRDALTAAGGPPALVTGQPAIQHDLDPVLESDLRHAEAIALPIALLVLLAAFGLSFAVAIPFLFATSTVTGTLLVVFGIAHELSMVTWVTSLVELIGLGLAIDYSLLIVGRFREELEQGADKDAAIVRTMATAGRAIVFSGGAVAAGLALLLLMPVPFIRSMGLAGFLIPLVSIAAALTLQPALLSVFGRRGVRRLHVFGARTLRFPWLRLGLWVTRRRLAVLVATTALLLAAALPALLLQLTPGSVAGLPRSLEAVRAFDLLQRRVAAGAVTPTQVVFDAGSALRARGAAERLANELFHDPEVLLVASGPGPPYADSRGRYTRVVTINRHEYGQPPTRRFVKRLRGDLIPRARLPAGAHAYAGGVPAQGVDFLDRAYGAFPWLVLAVLALTYVILLRAFRSLVLPLKAVVLNALTVAAAYGLLVLVFRYGVGAGALGVERTEGIDGWVPIFLFATVFGLSMDYEVFLVTRVREYWERLGDNRAAIAHGLERTGPVITAAAAIMAVAFSGFVIGRVAALQQFGLGLVLAVVIDATVVRCLLAPAFMAVLDQYNWWLPEWIERFFRARAGEAKRPG